MKKKPKFRCKSLILNIVSILIMLEFLLLCLYQILLLSPTNNSIRNTSCKLIIILSIIFVVLGIFMSLSLWLVEVFQKEETIRKDYRNYESEAKYRNYQNVYEDMEQKRKNEQQKYRYSTEKEAKTYRQQTTEPKSLFDGLDEKAANKKFKELIKKYHPDNGGSEEMTEKIMEEYREYKKRKSK